MRYRTFGRLGWQVSELGYGMWGMGGWTGSDDAESARALQAAVDAGITFFDTAWGYGEGHSESLLGALVRANPQTRIYTATKIPPKNFRWPSRRGDPIAEAFPPEHIRAYTEKSLANLGLPRVDLIQFHVWEDAWADDPGWQQAIADLKRDGLVAGVGVSINRWEPWNALRTRGDGADRRGAGDLQHLRPGAGGRAVPGGAGTRRRGDRARAVRRGYADRHADQGEPLAGGGLAQHLLRAREPALERGARRGAAAAGAGGRDDAGPGAALHPVEPGRQHGDPGHAQAAASGGEHRRRRTPGRCRPT